MFEIEVFSNPVNALVGEGGLLRHEDFARVAGYDEDLVKPALLLADLVTLRSHRLDLILNEERDIQMTDKLAPLSGKFLRLSAERDPKELRFLGLDEKDLLSEDEVKYYEDLFVEEAAAAEERRLRPMPTGRDAFIAQRESDRAAIHKHDSEWEAFMDRAEPFRRALRARLIEARQSFDSPALADIEATGILEQQPWDSLPKSRPRQIIDNLVGPNAEFERAFEAMVVDVVGTKKSVMLDDEVHAAIASLGSGDEAGSSTVVAGAVELMRMVQGVSDLPVDEVLGIREDLEEFISPFRSFVLEVSGRVDWDGASEAERARLLTIAWETDVAPAIAEMEAHVRSAGFIRNATDVFANSTETLRTVGVAIGIAVGAGFVGISTLAAGAAAAPPLLKALIGSVRAKEEAQRNRAYFVHALGAHRSLKRKRA